MDKETQQLNDFYKKAMDMAHEWGLKPFETEFHIVPSEKIYEIASYGIPNHFNHWSYGRDYWREKTMYDHGYGKIYELVINSDPAQAFLLDTNSLLENCFVIAHVIGHSDFFANNEYFSHTNRKIEVSAAAIASRIREYENKYGTYVVEAFIDDVFTIKEHIDPHLRTKKKGEEYELAMPEHQYIDMFPEHREEIKAAQLEEQNIKQFKFPREADRDIMRFIADHGRLKEWQRDIIMSIRDEMIYFLPQMQTKIMNEGWASVVHHRLMHALDPECDPGGIDFADTHSGVLSGRPGNLNPYWLGFNIYKRIENIGNDDEQGALHPEFWKRDGWQNCLEARTIERDETFLRDHLDKRLVEDLDMFTYEYDDEDAVWWISQKAWEKVRDNLVATKANMGMPYIVVENADYNNAGHLYLKHIYDGRPLEHKYAANTLKSVRKLWGKPVTLETQDEDGQTLKFLCEDEGKSITASWQNGKVKVY
jgi:stage V sporulation protein R